MHAEGSLGAIRIVAGGAAHHLPGMDGLPVLVFIALTFLIAGFVKGAIGLGLPTVSVGMLGLMMPPVQAAALLIVPSLVTNLWQLLAGPRFAPLARRFWPMLLAICIGTVAGAGPLAADSTGLATTWLGAALVVYALIGLSALRLCVPAHAEIWLSPLVGAATGLVTAATGVFVIPAVPYLQALALEKEDLVQALSLSFTVSTLALAAALARNGVFPVAIAGASVLALAPALIGMLLGQWLRLRVRPETFRFWFFIRLLALGALLALR